MTNVRKKTKIPRPENANTRFHFGWSANAWGEHQNPRKRHSRSPERQGQLTRKHVPPVYQHHTHSHNWRTTCGTRVRSRSPISFASQMASTAGTSGLKLMLWAAALATSDGHPISTNSTSPDTCANLNGVKCCCPAGESLIIDHWPNGNCECRGAGGTSPCQCMIEEAEEASEIEKAPKAQRPSVPVRLLIPLDRRNFKYTHSRRLRRLMFLQAEAAQKGEEPDTCANLNGVKCCCPAGESLIIDHWPNGNCECRGAGGTSPCQCMLNASVFSAAEE